MKPNRETKTIKRMATSFLAASLLLAAMMTTAGCSMHATGSVYIGTGKPPAANIESGTRRLENDDETKKKK